MSPRPVLKTFSLTMSYSYNQYNYRSNDANFGGSAGRSGGEINGNDEYDRGRQKRNGSRSRSRSESRDRKRRGSTNYDREGNRSYGKALTFWVF